MESEEISKLHYYFGLLARLIANLYDIAIHNKVPEEAKVQRVLRALADILLSEYTFVGKYEEEKRNIVIEHVFPLDCPFQKSFTYLEESIWDAVIEDQKSYAESMDDTDIVAKSLGIQTAIAAPFVLDDGVKRIIACCNKKVKEPYTYETYGSDEGKILEVVASLLANQLNRDRAVTYEFEKAAGIQRQLLPKRAPVIENIDLAHIYIPANTVGGDYYDFIPFTGEKVGILIGDVCGKGLSAALIMVIVRSFVHFVTEEMHIGCKLSETMFQLNNLIHRCVEPGMFVTLVYALLDTKEMLMKYCCAGHLPPMVYRAPCSRFEEIKEQSFGLSLGIELDTMYATHDVKLGQGDIVIMCTDGITEAKGERGEEVEQFGMQRLQASVVEVARKGATDIINEVQARLSDFQSNAEMHDDASMIVFKVK